jgi:hypothetical protein
MEGRVVIRVEVVGEEKGEEKGVATTMTAEGWRLSVRRRERKISGCGRRREREKKKKLIFFF